MPKRELEPIDYLRLARRLSHRVEPETIMAVVKVEKGQNAAFYADGFPTILFERHIFWAHANRAMRQQWFEQRPTICNPNPTPRGGYGTHSDQRIKFDQAFAHDPDAAMMACSWGCFQELGANYRNYDFATVGEFVDVMKSGIDGQCEIFIRSIRHRGLVDELEDHDWAHEAAGYNGGGYRRFNYDGQMATAYKAAKAQHIDWAKAEADASAADEIDAAVNSIGEAPAAQTDSAGSNVAALGDPAQESAAEPGAGAVMGPDPEAAPAPPAVEIKAGVIDRIDHLGDRFSGLNATLEKFGISNPLASTSVGTWLMMIVKFIFAGVFAAFGMLKDNPVYIAAAVVALGIAATVYHYSRKRVAAEKAGLPIDVVEKMVANP